MSVAPGTTLIVNEIFSDAPDSHAFYEAIEWISKNGITAGCGTNPLQYCPDDFITRKQMAVFLVRAMDWPAAPSVGSCAGNIFADVTSATDNCAYIEELVARGVTAGCATGPLKFCPDNPVTRGQMAVFLLRSKYYPSAIPNLPSVCTGTVWSDVFTNTSLCLFIERLAGETNPLITSGCNPGAPPPYCPGLNVTRGQMASFLLRTFDMPRGN